MFFLTKFKTCFKQKKLFKIKKTVCFVLNKKNMFFANPDVEYDKINSHSKLRVCAKIIQQFSLQPGNVDVKLIHCFGGKMIPIFFITGNKIKFKKKHTNFGR
jgi:hypothetical protein